MKNIHVLPTDKPSRVYNVLGSKRLGFTSNDPFFTENTGGGTQNQHIYITNSEEIKVGDWCFDINGKIFKHENHFPISIGQRKIILTTDQDLIKDGVQAIDDEFLEWFVKNPSCEEVEVTRDFADEGIKGITYYGKYFIIIPQEEPKQETLEEAAIDFINMFNGSPTEVELFIAGAKWQAERMYSEEDMKEAFKQGQNYENFDGEYSFKEWFEQFKKKQ